MVHLSLVSRLVTSTAGRYQLSGTQASKEARHINTGGKCHMRSKPIIGINADYRSVRKDSPAFSYVAAGYYDCVQRVGAVPVIVPPYEDDADIDALLDRLDGFVMVGGPDLDPRRDGFMMHPSVRLLEERRENFDRRLM